MTIFVGTDRYNSVLMFTIWFSRVESWDEKNDVEARFINLLYFRQGTSFVTTFDTCVTYKFKHSHKRVAYFEYFKMAYLVYFILLDLLERNQM